MAAIHHSAICTLDLDASLRFWRDGLGFTVLMDMPFDGDWPTLFRARTTRLHSVFLGDPAAPDAGVVELVDFGPGLPEPDAPDEPARGFFLLSLFTDVEATLARLAELGLGGEPRRTVTHGVVMAVVRDPNGVLVELIESGARRNLDAVGVDPS